jgi:16S rRNA (guanine1207-N2)-methyltransferase
VDQQQLTVKQFGARAASYLTSAVHSKGADLDRLTELVHKSRPACVLDLGCGAGPLGIVAARLSGSGPVTLVDADVEAVRSATRSVAAAGVENCRVLPSDIAGAVLDQRFDVVVTNPPFHVGKATDLDVPLQFIRDAWDVLDAGGRLLLVANRTLPYERPIYQRFGNIATLVNGRRFKVLSATRA